MLNTTFDEDQLISNVLSQAERHDLHDAKTSLGVFLTASQQGGQHGIYLSLFHQIMILGVLQAANNAGLENAAEAVTVFKRVRAAMAMATA